MSGSFRIPIFKWSNETKNGHSTLFDGEAKNEKKNNIFQLWIAALFFVYLPSGQQQKIVLCHEKWSVNTTITIEGRTFNEYVEGWNLSD